MTESHAMPFIAATLAEDGWESTEAPGVFRKWFEVRSFRDVFEQCLRTVNDREWNGIPARHVFFAEISAEFNHRNAFDCELVIILGNQDLMIKDGRGVCLNAFKVYEESNFAEMFAKAEDETRKISERFSSWPHVDFTPSNVTPDPNLDP